MASIWERTAPILACAVGCVSLDGEISEIEFKHVAEASSVGLFIGTQLSDWFDSQSGEKIKACLKQVVANPQEDLQLVVRLRDRPGAFHFLKKGLAEPEKQQGVRFLQLGFRWNQTQQQIDWLAVEVTEQESTRILFQEIQAVGQIGVWRLVVDTMTTKWSDETYRIHEVPIGTPTDVINGISFYEPEAQPVITNLVKRSIENAEPYEVELKFRTAKGRSLWVRAIGKPIVVDGRVVEVVGTFQDITEAKAKSERIQENSARLARVIKNSPGMVYQFLLSKEGQFSFPFVSQHALEIYEISAEELGEHPMALDEFVHKDDRAGLGAKILESASTLAPFEWSGRIVTRSGKLKWIKARSIPERQADGSVLWDGIVIDWTKERQLEMSLEASLERLQVLRHFFELSRDLLCVIDFSGRFQVVNPAWITTLGWKSQDLEGNSSIDFIHPEDREGMQEHLQLLTGGAEEIVFENRFLHRDGSYRWLSWVISVSQEDQEIYGGARDITELKKAQVQMVHSSQLAALGEMAGGVAHEINNPLAIIQGKAEQLLDLASDEGLTAEGLAQGLEKIRQTCLRISKIVKGLKSFSRSSDSEPLTQIRLAHVLDDALELSRERMKSRGIQLAISVDPTLELECRPVQIGQVFLNLLNNSFDAVVGTEKPWIEIRAKQKNGWVRIEVVDSGSGIPKEVLDKVMLPFFTTKEVGKGTGLGLSISKGIIEEHSGRLWIDLKAASTTFVIELPLRQPDSKPVRLA